MKQARDKQALRCLPNIGEEMARCLEQAGIRTPQQLRKLGSIRAAVLVNPCRRCGPVCQSALSGLEGAIRGVRWHLIPKVERDKLWDEYRRCASVPARARKP